MNINKVTVAWNGFMTSLGQAIEEWKPKTETTELGYRDSLVAHLRKCAPEARVEPEYRHAGTTADICFKWDGILFPAEAFVELKRNLHQKPQYDRLVGQIEGLDPRRNRIIVVLCGETNPTLADRLRHHYKEFLAQTSDQKMAIIVK